MESLKQLIRSTSPCWTLNPGYCEFPPLLPAPSSSDSPILIHSVFWVREKEVGLLGCILGSYTFAFPCERNQDAEIFSGIWLWALPPQKRGYVCNGKLLFLPSLMCPSLEILLQWCTGTFPLDPWMPTFILGVVKSVQWGDDSWSSCIGMHQDGRHPSWCYSSVQAWKNFGHFVYRMLLLSPRI